MTKGRGYNSRESQGDVGSVCDREVWLRFWGPQSIGCLR